MCGRFALYATKEEIEAEFDLQKSLQMMPRFNICPSEMIPVVLPKHQLNFLRWGFLPHWQKENVEEPGTLQPGFINARSETIEEKPTFKYAYKKNRCLIIASGYYEWKSDGAQKQPFYIQLKNHKLIAFAGIWDAWKSKDGLIESCAIITQDARNLGALGAIHERMPIVIPKEHYQSWLKGALIQDLKQYEPDEYQFFPVSTKVGSPKFDDPLCVKPLSLS